MLEEPTETEATVLAVAASMAALAVASSETELDAVVMARRRSTVGWAGTDLMTTKEASAAVVSLAVVAAIQEEAETRAVTK